jgi:hypothetical protein
MSPESAGGGLPAVVTRLFLTALLIGQNPGSAGLLITMLLVRGIPAGICRSVRTAAPGPAARGPGRGGRTGGLSRRGAGGAGWRTAGPVHPLGCAAPGGARSAKSRPVRGPSPRPRRRRPGAARSAGRPGTVRVAVREGIAAAAPLRVAVCERLALLAGTDQSGWPYPAGTDQVAQPAPEHPWPVSAGSPPGSPLRPAIHGQRAPVPRLDGRRAIAGAGRREGTGCWSAW